MILKFLAAPFCVRAALPGAAGQRAARLAAGSQGKIIMMDLIGRVVVCGSAAAAIVLIAGLAWTYIQILSMARSSRRPAAKGDLLFSAADYPLVLGAALWAV